MKALVALALAAALALSACDAGEMPNSPDVRGAAGASGAAGMDGTAGMTGTAGGGGVGGGDYVPDPAPTCEQATPGGPLIACDAGGGSAPTFDATGTQCFSCPDSIIPETGCAFRLPAAVAGGKVIHGPRDAFCPFSPCDPSLCHAR